jgi:3-dehydroquinate synthase
MVDMSTLSQLKVKSNIHDYAVSFIDNFDEAISDEVLYVTSHFIIDKSIHELYEEQLGPVLRSGRYLVVEATEDHKTLNNRIKRGDRIIGVGGGIIQDITSFISSIMFRGLDWVLYPTTLLAQCDSCIGSKSSINVGEFKNQLGTFYPPQRIMLDVSLLKTLAPREIRSGLGEMIKVHLMDGMGSLMSITEKYDAGVSPDYSVLKELIIKSLEIKKGIIEQDEFDRDYRNILNYGHTFGHAIESITNYEVCHGQAVTVGMDIANYISFRLGILSKNHFDMMRVTIMKNYPEFRLKREQVDRFIVALTRDKKNVDENLSMILTEGPGKMSKKKLPFDEKLKEYINDYSGGICGA